MELTGRIKLIMDEQKFDSGFYKKDFVVTTEEQYPQDIMFTLNKERTEFLNNYNVGDSVLVRFDVRGREWQGKYFVNLVAWKLEAATAGAPTGAPAEAAPVAQAPPNAAAFPKVEPVDVNTADEDDLPF
jgi:single-strand DNA-binding protein